MDRPLRVALGAAVHPRRFRPVNLREDVPWRNNAMRFAAICEV